MKQLDLERCYHSMARIEWIKRQLCSYPRCGRTPCDNAHIAGDGMSRKGHHTLIIPLCRKHHQRFHTVGAKQFQEEYLYPLAQAAAFWHASWERFHD